MILLHSNSALNDLTALQVNQRHTTFLTTGFYINCQPFFKKSNLLRVFTAVMNKVRHCLWVKKSALLKKGKMIFADFVHVKSIGVYCKVSEVLMYSG